MCECAVCKFPGYSLDGHTIQGEIQSVQDRILDIMERLEGATTPLQIETGKRMLAKAEMELSHLQQQ